ncbi:uncharacterized protein, partial [Brachionichthys hirsutus]|uniref:uncharacterized protein n=1 Tax=Brachionichthys hirsutus TaxID=412623 RepID=UPI003604DFF9
NVRSLNNKSFLCHDFITLNNLDFFIITETWLPEGDYSALIEATPPDYTHLNQPRLSGKGGGVAAIFRNVFKCIPVSYNSYTSFEYLGFMVNSCDSTIIIIIYRPPKTNSVFIQEFAELVSYFITKHDRILILGDFNIHVFCPTHPLVNDFIETIDSLGLSQAVQVPTHNKGHTLDLVLHSGVTPENVETKDICVSDHKAILFRAILSPQSFNHSAPV